MKKTSKILSIILAILMVISIIPITASAATYSGTCGENITWEFDVTTKILTISGAGNMNDYLKNNRPSFESYKSQIETIIINNGVIQIGTCAFYNYTNLKNVTISDGVKAIGTSAFYGCTNLTNIVIPDSVTSIDSNSFASCTNLADITIPDSVTSIGYRAFNNTAYYNDESNWESNVLYIGNHLYQAKYTIVGNIVIKNGTKTIADNSFMGCDNLTNITIPDSVKIIGESVFFNCDSLVTVTIPDSVEVIGVEAFSLCDNLQSIIVDVNNQYFSSDEYGVLFNKDKSTLIQYPGGNKQTNYLIPDTVSEIVAWAFGHAYDLVSITIPDSVTKIGNDAFYYCSNLTGVKIGKGVTEISEEMLGECNSLVTINIPDSVVTIGERAFYECNNLTNVIIGKNVTSIGWCAFEECPNIKNVYYANTKDNWEAIAIDNYNYSLTNATIHYNSTGPHTHDYESAITPPTCTEQGYTTYTCECGDTYIDDYVNALGHTEETISAIAPTCTVSGLTAGVKCSVCDEVFTEQETVPALGHSHTSKITTSATHTTTGVMTYTCSCGDTYTEVIEKLEKHNHEAVVTAPTCTEQGHTTYTCECGDSYVADYVDALGHTPANAVEENYVAPTCTENGSKDVVIYCSVCDEELSRETETTEATDHADNDGDGYCDACDEQLEDNNDSQISIMSIIMMIINFILKLFGIK